MADDFFQGHAREGRFRLHFQPNFGPKDQFCSPMTQNAFFSSLARFFSAARPGGRFGGTENGTGSDCRKRKRKRHQSRKRQQSGRWKRRPEVEGGTGYARKLKREKAFKMGVFSARLRLHARVRVPEVGSRDALRELLNDFIE